MQMKLITTILLSAGCIAGFANNYNVAMRYKDVKEGQIRKNEIPTVTRGEDGVELSADSIIIDAHIVIFDECRQTVANTVMTISPAPIHITLPDSPQKEYEPDKSYTIEIKYDDASLVGEFK